MTSEECPRCAALLTLETKGELLDKIQLCAHCGFERDVLDEVTIQQEEPGKKVTIHRRDLGSEEVSSQILGNSDLQAKVREMTGMDMADLLSSAQTVQSSGKSVSRTSSTTRSYSGAEAEQKLAEMGMDLGKLVREAQATGGGVAKQPSNKTGLVILVGIVLLLTALGTFFWMFLQPAS